MGDSCFVNAELDTARFDLFDSIGNIECNGIGLSARHKAAGSEDFTEASRRLHYIRCGDYCIEIKSAVLDLCNQIFAADDVRACILSFLLLVTERQHCDFLCVAGSEGKDYCAAYLLVCMTGINAQTNMEFEAFIKFRGRAFLCERYCL